MTTMHRYPLDREFRMYGLVPYNLSPMQQGIQFGHGVVEFSILYGPGSYGGGLLTYEKWALRDKTFIVLNGGTTNNNPDSLGTLNQHLEIIRDDFDLYHATFHEPDLGDQLTAVVFLLDERVFNKKLYPSPEFNKETGEYGQDYQELVENMGGDYYWRLRQFMDQFKFA